MAKRLVSALLILALCLGSSSALAARGQYEVTASKLTFREEASSEGERIAMLSKGTVVTVLDTSGGWAETRWNGKTGYLSTEYLEKVSGDCVDGKNTTKLSGSAWVKRDTKLYQAADVDSEAIAEVDKGTKLSLRGETVNFYYVKVDGKKGYILKNKTSTQAVESSGQSNASDDRTDSGEEENARLLSRGMNGSAVRELQERLADLGYLDEDNVTGYFGSLTHAAVERFQTQAGLAVDGVAGPATQDKLYSSSAPKAQKVVEMDWETSNVSSLVYKRGGTATIIDCATGTHIKVRRVGGSNHMDLEPATAEDTEKLLDIYGGSWSWDRRAVVLVAGGKYIAASINGMPHGDEISTSNNFEGQFCLHTTGSRTHGTDKVDSGHQRCIQKALNYFS